MPDKKRGSKQRILDFLLANIGRVIDGEEIREASGNVSEWARRVRELRDEEGYQILTHRDRRDLLTQVRRATIDDQLYLLEWLEHKFAKNKPEPEK
jgi:hypothetical protein